MLQLKWRVRAFVRGCTVGASFVATSALAENAPLITHDDPVALPGMGRVVLGFLLTVALACVIVYGLRRWLPRFANRYATQNSLIAMQTVVQNGLKLHVVTIDGQTVLIVEGRTGVAMTPLKPTSVANASAAP